MNTEPGIVCFGSSERGERIKAKVQGSISRFINLFKVGKSLADLKNLLPFAFILCHSKKPFTFNLSLFTSKDKNDDNTHIPG